MDKHLLKFDKTHLPFGAGVEIAKRAGVTVQTVSHFMTGKTNSRIVEIEIIKYISELRQVRNELMAQLL